MKEFDYVENAYVDYIAKIKGEIEDNEGIEDDEEE